MPVRVGMVCLNATPMHEVNRDVLRQLGSQNFLHVALIGSGPRLLGTISIQRIRLSIGPVTFEICCTAAINKHEGAK